jgi:signal transduction histidine kinase
MTSSSSEKAGKRLKSFTTLTPPHSDARNREAVFKVVLAGTGIGMLALFILLLVSFGALKNHYVLGRVVVCGLAVLYLFGTYRLAKSRHKALAPFLLVGFYMALAIGTVWQWGTNTPFGILLLGISIVLASTLLASPNALRAAVVSCVTVIGLQISQNIGLVTPDQSWSGKPSTLGDALGYSVGFSILALISWLFARQTERSLQRAEAAEAALLEEKAMLEVRIKERTDELRTAQIAEMQQLHQFAEVGQLSTALLHDLANHLTVLTLEIEGIQSQKHATAIQRARHIIGHLDTMVDSVRDRLRGTTSQHAFNLVTVISEIVEFNRYRHVGSPVKLQWEAPRQRHNFQYFGDPLRLSQIITIVVTNAIDAYSADNKQKPQKATVVVTLEKAASDSIIRIIDYGRGISAAQREKLFKEVSSSKQEGMGIGLYLAKQMLQTQFRGSIELSPATGRTEFIISLPQKA